jgi:hypothetical protein
MTETTTMLSVPQDFPADGVETGQRRLLEAIVSGLAPPPPCVPRFALPRPAAWSYGVLAGIANPTDTETWAPGIVFGRPGEASVRAQIVRLTRRGATIEVVLAQRGRTVSLATVRQVIRL